jgi:hypothetical protein
MWYVVCGRGGTWYVVEGQKYIGVLGLWVIGQYLVLAVDEAEGRAPLYVVAIAAEQVVSRAGEVLGQQVVSGDVVDEQH